MICNKCGGTLKIVRSKVTASNAVKRSRMCYCPELTTTYERESSEALNTYEHRLVTSFRELTPHQRATLWALVRSFKKKDEL